MAISNCNNINSSNHTSETLVVLHEDIIFMEILPRLPVKILIRFKCVSKSWHSLISDPKFALLHFNFSYSSERQLILPKVKPFEFLVLPYDEMNNLKPYFEIDIHSESCHDKNTYEYDIVNVCNGLLCLYNACSEYKLTNNGNDHKLVTDCDFFSICNPATHQYRVIPNPTCQNRHLMPCRFSDWFGYVPSVDDYKIVTFFDSKESDESDDGVYVYSVRSRRWKKLSDLTAVLLRNRNCCLETNTVVCDDMLYWSPQGLYKDSIRPNHIIGFNMITEQVKQFPWMDWLNPYNEIQFIKTRGCLAMFCSLKLGTPIADVWTLKQCDDWCSWEKTFSVHCGTGSPLSCCLWRVSPCGFFFFLYKSNLIDTSKDTQEQLRGDAYPYDLVGQTGYGGGFYSESLIWPFQSIESAEELKIVRADHV